MSTTSAGRHAETLAAEYLTGRGFTVLDRNWRNRWCEIDIVARYGPVVHFVEVKYRRSTTYGYAAEYVSHDKAARLGRAALAWNRAHGYAGMFQVDLVTVEGTPNEPAVGYVPNILF